MVQEWNQPWVIVHHGLGLHKNLLCEDKCLLEPVLVDLNQVVQMFIWTQGAAFLVSDWIEEKGEVLVGDA